MRAALLPRCVELEVQVPLLLVQLEVNLEVEDHQQQWQHHQVELQVEHVEHRPIDPSHSQANSHQPSKLRPNHHSTSSGRRSLQKR